MKANLLTVPEAAARMAVSEKTTWRMVYGGKLGVVRIGRCVRVTDTSVESVIEGGTTPPKFPDIPESTSDSESWDEQA